MYFLNVIQYLNDIYAYIIIFLWYSELLGIYK